MCYWRGMSQTFTLPQPPDPVKAQQYAGQIRTLIALLAGAGVIGGAWIGVSQEQLVSLVTAAMTLASLVGAAWAAISSWRQKAAARAELAASARESASRGTPVVVTVTPAGEPNALTHISATEAARAPSVPLGATPSPAPVLP